MHFGQRWACVLVHSLLCWHVTALVQDIFITDDSISSPEYALHGRRAINWGTVSRVVGWVTSTVGGAVAKAEIASKICAEYSDGGDQAPIINDKIKHGRRSISQESPSAACVKSFLVAVEHIALSSGRAILAWIYNDSSLLSPDTHGAVSNVKRRACRMKRKETVKRLNYVGERLLRHPSEALSDLEAKALPRTNIVYRRLTRWMRRGLTAAEQERTTALSASSLGCDDEAKLKIGVSASINGLHITYLGEVTNVWEHTSIRAHRLLINDAHLLDLWADSEGKIVLYRSAYANRVANTPEGAECDITQGYNTSDEHDIYYSQGGIQATIWPDERSEGYIAGAQKQIDCLARVLIASNMTHVEMATFNDGRHAQNRVSVDFVPDIPLDNVSEPAKLAHANKGVSDSAAYVQCPGIDLTLLPVAGEGEPSGMLDAPSHVQHKYSFGSDMPASRSLKYAREQPNSKTGESSLASGSFWDSDSDSMFEWGSSSDESDAEAIVTDEDCTRMSVTSAPSVKCLGPPDDSLGTPDDG